MARNKPTCAEPPAASARRPYLVPGVNRSNVAAAQTCRGHGENRELDEFGAELAWQAHIATGRIEVR